MHNNGETLENMSRLLVQVQLELLELQNYVEKENYENRSSSCYREEVFFSPGPPQILKLAIPVFLPKIQVHGLRYPKERAQATNYQQVRDIWFSSIRKALYDHEEKLINLQTFTSALVWVKFYFPDRRVRDVDNYSLKFINDALVRCRVISDDDHRCLRLVVEGEVDKDNPRTEIMVVEDEGQLDKIRSNLQQRAYKN